MSTVTEIRQRLEVKKSELADRLDRIHHDRMRTDAPLSPDFAEQVVQRENDEVLDRLEVSTEADLLQVNHALTRLAAGLHGVCEVCSYPIEPERLAVLPQATACTSCVGRFHERAA